VSWSVKNQMVERLRDLSELVSNCLEIYSTASGEEDFAGLLIENQPQRLMEESVDLAGRRRRFPKWLNRWDRVLLDLLRATI
ncbi:pectinesterase, partial [Sarracenia purpurea var. burkii]